GRRLPGPRGPVAQVDRSRAGRAHGAQRTGRLGVRARRQLPEPDLPAATGGDGVPATVPVGDGELAAAAVVTGIRPAGGADLLAPALARHVAGTGTCHSVPPLLLGAGGAVLRLVLVDRQLRAAGAPAVPRAAGPVRAAGGSRRQPAGSRPRRPTGHLGHRPAECPTGRCRRCPCPRLASSSAAR